MSNDDSKQSGTSWITVVTGVVTGVGALFAAVTQMLEGANKLAAARLHLTLGPAGWWTIFAVLAFVSVGAIRSGLSRRSRLLRPEALVLKSDRVEHLRGRDDAIEALTALCANHAHVNLVGESGSGKTALLRSGIVPFFRKAGSSFLPIYIDSWGTDWSEGPTRSVLSTLVQQLTAEQRKTLDVTGEAEDLVDALSRVASKLELRPLLIFDQFDDYQTQHQPRFLPPDTRTWLSSEVLKSVNEFWRQIAAMLRNESIHCLVATRADAAAGLESIRFITPKTYSLDRLRPLYVEPLLDELTTPAAGESAVIANPEKGWSDLKGRIADDLGARGSVLPAQMKLALKGLGNLRYLTPREYDRHGRLEGLEAADVEWYVQSAASSHNITARAALAVLTALVDRDSMKTHALPLPRIKESIGPQSPNDDLLATLLDSWEQRELVRKRIDADTGMTVWMLDHDYLCRGVIAAERRANLWATRLQEGKREFDAAGSQVDARWRSLLPLTTQARLLIERMRGRIEYGAARTYAIVSMARLLPVLVVAAIPAFTIFLLREQGINDKARTLLDPITIVSEQLSLDEERALRKIAASSESVAMAVMREAVASNTKAAQVRGRLPYVINAVVGLDPRRRERVLKEVLIPCAISSTDEAKHLCLDAAFFLEANDPVLVREYVAAFSTLSRHNHVYETPIDWKMALARCSPPERQHAVHDLLSTFTFGDDTGRQMCLAMGTRECGQVVVDLLLHGNATQRDNAASVIPALTEKDPSTAAEVSTAIAQHMTEKTSPGDLAALASALGKLKVPLDPSVKQRLTHALVNNTPAC